MIGWTITISYGVVALLWLSTGLRLRKTGSEPEHEFLWFAGAAIFALLGINKQLDLQTLLIELGRNVARSEGWYAHRRQMQGTFAMIVVGASLLGLLALIWNKRRFFGSHPLILPGGILLLAYLVLRTISIDHLDRRIGLNFDESKWLAAIETSGIACMAMASVHALKMRHR